MVSSPVEREGKDSNEGSRTNEEQSDDTKGAKGSSREEGSVGMLGRHLSYHEIDVLERASGKRRQPGKKGRRRRNEKGELETYLPAVEGCGSWKKQPGG